MNRLSTYRWSCLWFGSLLVVALSGVTPVSAGQQQTYTAADPRLQKIPVALNGMCPLTAAEDHKLVSGKPEFQYLFGSHRYYFASKEQLLRFHAAQKEEKKKWVPALCGLCPVSNRKTGDEIWGSPAFAAEFDGHTYWCADAAAQAEFQAHPQKYAPVFAGDCAYCYVLEQVRVEGSWYFSTFVNGRLYLFPEQATLDKFLQSSEQARFIDMDLIRQDPVEQKAGRTVAGQPEFAATEQGFTYYFANAANRDTFLQDPPAYRRTP